MIINMMEQYVAEAYDRLKSAVPGFPDTPRHREDVIVYSLNRLKPRYVVTAEGKAVVGVSLDSTQEQASIDVQVLTAIRLVTESPGGRKSE